MTAAMEVTSVLEVVAELSMPDIDSMLELESMFDPPEDPLSAGVCLNISSQSFRECEIVDPAHMGCAPSVMGVPFGAETAGSLMALSLTRWGRAVAKPERRATRRTREAIILRMARKQLD